MLAAKIVRFSEERGEGQIGRQFRWWLHMWAWAQERVWPHQGFTIFHRMRRKNGGLPWTVSRRLCISKGWIRVC